LRPAGLDNGEPFLLEDWQQDFAADFFSGTKQSWLIVPEGNGKTTFLAALALYHADYTPDAAGVIAAAAREQAELMYVQARGFVDRTPGMSDRFRCFDGYRRIKSRRLRGVVQVKAADDRTGDGIIPTLCLIDELHRHRDLALLRTWIGKLRKRKGQLVVISTAGEPGTEFEDARDRIKKTAREVETGRDGCFTRAVGKDVILHEYAVPSVEFAEDMRVVAKANPRMDITAAVLRDERDDPVITKEHWLRFKCNIAIRGTGTAILPEEWSALGTDERIPGGAEVWLGVDFGWKHDTTAIVPLMVGDSEHRLFGKPVVLVPPRDGSFLEPEEIKDAFRDLFERYDVREVVMDPDRGAEIAAWIRDELGVEPTEHGQGVEMFDAYERFMEAIRNGWIRHPRDPVFSEHVLNAIAKTQSDGRARFDRPATSRAAVGQRRRVIDALVAAAMVNRSAFAEASDDVFVGVFG
jgi:phage terminase large subunit-like protein